LPFQDRRRRPTPPFSQFTFRGRRRQIPPNSDSNYYVDHPSAEAWKSALLLVCLSVLDAFLSLWLFTFDGIIEGNPLLFSLLNSSPYWFLGVKLVLTLLSILILLIHWNFVIAGRTVRVIWLIRTFVAAYLVIITYEVLLLFHNI